MQLLYVWFVVVKIVDEFLVSFYVYFMYFFMFSLCKFELFNLVSVEVFILQFEK